MAGAGGNRPPAPHARADRDLLAHPLRNHRSGLVLRGDAPRACARRRPQLYTAVARRRGGRGCDRARAGEKLAATAAAGLELVTFTPDELDWDEEVRIALEERASLSPDALTGLEANLRFPGAETMETRIFGRLSAWQNWIFSRPNAVGEHGALKVYGTGAKAKFDRERV